MFLNFGNRSAFRWRDPKNNQWSRRGGREPGGLQSRVVGTPWDGASSPHLEFLDADLCMLLKVVRGAHMYGFLVYGLPKFCFQCA